MTNVDNLKKLEEKISNLFIQANFINHEFYNTLDRKIKLFAEFYIYSDFFNTISSKIELKDKSKIIQKEKIVKNLNFILSEDFVIKSSKNVDFIGEIFNSILIFTTDDRDKIHKKVGEKYKAMSLSIIRKMKIKLLLKKGD